MNYKQKINFLKKFFIEILKNRNESEELKSLIEKIETIEELNQILQNNNLSPIEKDIEFIKSIAKRNIQNNRAIGIKSKLALITIINKNEPIKKIVLEIVDFIVKNNLIN